jgi:hypothetical protein
MKRPELKKLGVGSKRTFVGIFQHKAKRFQSRGNTLIQCCVGSVVDEETGELVTDHSWIAFYIREVDLLNIKEGDIIRFYGLVKTYGKNYGEVNTGIRATGLDRILKRKKVA